MKAFDRFLLFSPFARQPNCFFVVDIWHRTGYTKVQQKNQFWAIYLIDSGVEEGRPIKV